MSKSQMIARLKRLDAILEREYTNHQGSERYYRILEVQEELIRQLRKNDNA